MATVLFFLGNHLLSLGGGTSSADKKGDKPSRLDTLSEESETISEAMTPDLFDRLYEEYRREYPQQALVMGVLSELRKRCPVRYVVEYEEWYCTCTEIYESVSIAELEGLAGKVRRKCKTMPASEKRMLHEGRIYNFETAAVVGACILLDCREHLLGRSIGGREDGKGVPPRSGTPDRERVPRWV